MPTDGRRRKTRRRPKHPPARFHRLAARLWRTHEDLQKAFAAVRFEVDRLIIAGMLNDLIWAAENCSVLAHHQVGKALGDSGGVEWARLSRPEQDRIRRARRAAAYPPPAAPTAPSRRMSAPRRTAELQRIARALKAEHRRIERLKPHIVLDCDRWALDRDLTSLVWAIEHCWVIMNHERGKSLADDNGYYVPPGLAPSVSDKRRLKPGETVAQVNMRQLKSSVR